ncbi:MAG: DNA-directed RNA polymerase subunit K, partial [Thermoproteota archaeon]|nr:DNA-directed RNA polymerase subunit K [Thermoproteota archaeon]
MGARSLQIALGAPPLLKPSGKLSKPMDIALKEFEMGVLPTTIRRTLPDGTYEDIPIKWLL